MHYRRNEAKEYSRRNFRGIWAAALTPFTPELAIDEVGLRPNLQQFGGRSRHRQPGYRRTRTRSSSGSRPEPNGLFDIAVDEAKGTVGTIMSCSDQNMDVVLDLARHAQAIGADYIVVHAPVLHFLHEQDETLFAYLQAHQRAGRHRDRAVEPSRQRLSDEPGAVRAGRRAAERGRDQIQRAAGDVCQAHAHGRRQILVSTASEAESSITSSSSAGSSTSAPTLPTSCRPRPIAACATTPISRFVARSPRRARSAIASIRCARRSSARGRRKSPRHTPSIGRTCSARRAGRCAPPDAAADRSGEGRRSQRIPRLRLEIGRRRSHRRGLKRCKARYLPRLRGAVNSIYLFRVFSAGRMAVTSTSSGSSLPLARPQAKTR